jgi:predicted amidophosphoribosyltransferase
MAGQTETLRCNGCWRDIDRDDLDTEQMCPDCSEEVSHRPPPPGRSEPWERDN